MTLCVAACGVDGDVRVHPASGRQHWVEDDMTTDIAFRRIDHLRFFVGNARQSAYFYRNAFGFDVVAYAGLETGVRHEAGYVLRQGEITFVLASPLSADHPENSRLRHRTATASQDIAWRSTTSPAAYARRPVRGAVGAGRADAWRKTTAAMNSPRSAPMATPRTASSTATDTTAFSPPVSSRSTATGTSPRPFHPVGLKAIDHVVAQRRRRQDAGVGEVLRTGARVLPPGPLRRQGHQHRVHRLDVEGGAGRPRPDQVPDQRAGQGQAAVADRGVPPVLRRPRRPAHRDGHRRHHRDRPGDAQ